MTEERSVGGTVTFTRVGAELDVTARIVTPETYTPEECAGVVAWVRSRWPPPASVVGISFTFEFWRERK